MELIFLMCQFYDVVRDKKLCSDRQDLVYGTLLRVER